MSKAVSDSSSILKLVNKTLELPTIPEVLMKLREVIDREDATAQDVAEVIALDPSVSTNILRIVNSAYYGLQVRVSSVSLAVSIMGFSMTKKVALKAAVFSVFANKKHRIEHFDPVGFWKHSIFTGVAARVLGLVTTAFAETHAEDLYVCGLLHDIGKIIMLEKSPDQHGDVLSESSSSQRPEIEVEQDVYGFTHADVGSVLAIKWFLPEDLTIAIRYHHTPTKDPFQKSLSSLIHLADRLAWNSSYPSTVDTKAPELDIEVYDQVCLDPQKVEALLPQVHEDFDATDMPW